MTRSMMSSTRSTPAPSRSASKPGSERSGPTPDRDRRQDLEADRRHPHRPAPAAHPVGLRARAAPCIGPGGRGRQVERGRHDPLTARQAAPQGLAGDDRRGRQLSADRRADRRGRSRLPADGQQPKLLSGIKAALERAAPETVQSCERAETAHGRQEHRRCTVAPAPAGLGDKTPWAGLKSVAAVHGTVVRGGKVTTLTRYYITSRTLTADQLLEAVRGQIENSVHWVLDVVFGDDCSRLRSDYGPRNMALVQRIALNLIRRTPSGKDSLTVKRKKAGWSTTYLIETIAAVPA